MKIREVEEQTGLTRANIRFYESKGLLKPQRQENNYRDYTQQDLEQLQRIVLLRKLGVPVEDIHQLLLGETSLRDTIVATQEELQKKIEELNGALELCKIIEERKETLDSLDVAEYRRLLEEKEEQGKQFMDIMGDILEDYTRDVVEGQFGICTVKGSRLLGGLATLGIAGVWIAFLNKVVFQDPASGWVSYLLMPFVIFLVVSVIYIANRVIEVKCPTAGKVFRTVLLVICMCIFLAVAGLLIWGLLISRG
ncbi:MAG: MerR family transcriptional regulator [Lachnospiraceae bacterium]|nr:MerR family transcriptional regulator [Lachnospiraceae bacterium]